MPRSFLSLSVALFLVFVSPALLYAQSSVETTISGAGTMDGHDGYWQIVTLSGVLQGTNFLFTENGYVRDYAFKMYWQDQFTVMPESTYVVPTDSMNIGDSWNSWLLEQTVATVTGTETIQVPAGTFFCYVVTHRRVAEPHDILGRVWWTADVGGARVERLGVPYDLVNFSLTGGTGFFPLSVGNTWESEVSSPPPPEGSFPIAAASDSSMAGSAAFDYVNHNYLVGLQGDAASSENITAQLLSSTGSLLGPRISVGRRGDLLAGVPTVAFGGTNYLMTWTDHTGSTNDAYGQLIGTSGNLIGSVFPIAATSDDEYCGDVASGNSTYLVVWAKNNIVYAQRLNKSGTLLGSPLALDAIAGGWTGWVGLTAVDFDGTNYLVVWQHLVSTDPERYDVRGEFISEAGGAGGIFTINEFPSPRFNPVGVARSGSDFLVTWNKDVGPGYPADSDWDIYGRMVHDWSGPVGHEFPITTDVGSQIMASPAYDGYHFLVTWTDLETNNVKGMYFEPTGAPDSTEALAIWDTMATYTPLSGLVFGGNQYLSVATMGSWSSQPPSLYGGAYGKFLSPNWPVEVQNQPLPARADILLPNQPNPFHSSTAISFNLPNRAVVSLQIFDVLGRRVATLCSKELPAGQYSRQWDASGLPNGIYSCHLRAGTISETRSIVLLR